LQFSWNYFILYRHKHSFIGNNFEKLLPQSETNLTRYHTNLTLNQVERKETVVPDNSSFDIKCVKSDGTTAENVLTKKSREGENDNKKLPERNIQLKTVRTIRLIF